MDIRAFSQKVNRKLLNRCQGLLYLSGIKQKIDWGQFDAIHEKYLKEDYDPTGPLKYLNDYKVYIKLNMDRVLESGLHNSKAKRILDIGCGFGYFMFICKHFGHEVIGLDFEEGNHPESRCYGDMIQMFGLQRILHKIEKYKPLPPLGEPFDLVAAFPICFSLHNSSERWEKDEWQFFLQNLKSCIKTDGQVYLDFNRREDDRSFHSDMLKAYFVGLGAHLLKDDNVVFFNSASLLTD